MNEALRKSIKRYEGFSLIPYRCPKRKLTIGWGWNFDDNPLPEDIAQYLHDNGKITVEMAERLLDIAIEFATEDAKKLLMPEFETWSDNRKLAVINMSYQHGYDEFSKYYPTFAYMKKGDWDTVAKRLERVPWYKQSGRRSKEIVKLLRDG
jgi:lysozyme